MPTTDEEKLIISLEARLSKYEREMKRATVISSQTARKIESDFSRLDRSLSRMGAGLKSSVSGFIGGFASAFGAQQLFQIARSAAAAGDAIGDLAEQTGATTDSIQELRYAAAQTGSSVEQMDTAIAKFAVNLGEAQKGSGDLSKLLKANGIALKDAAGKTRSFNDVFDDVVELVRRAPDQFSALEVVTTAFGARNDELVTTLRQGTAGLAAWAAELRRTGLVISEDGIKKLGELDAAFNKATLGIATSFQKMTVVAAPALQELLDGVEQVLRDITDLVAIADRISQGDFAGALKIFQQTGTPETRIPAQIAQIEAEIASNIDMMETYRRMVERGTINEIAGREKINDLLVKELQLKMKLAELRPPGLTIPPYLTRGAAAEPATVIPTKAADDAAKAAAKVEGELRQMQASLASTRKLPLNDELREALEYAAKINKLIIEVTSGGQAAKGTPGPRTGSTRHDLGRAADIQIRDPVTGRLLDSGNPADLVRINQLLETLASAGLTGFGGPGYMGPNRVHVGYGTAATWGGMPASTQEAINRGRANPVYVAGVEGARLSAEQDVADAIIKQNEALAAQKELINQLQWDRYLEERASAIEAQTAQLDAMRDLASDVFSGIVADIRAGASAAEIFSNVLDKLISKLADMAVNMLVSSLFGPGGTAIPGLLGGLIPGRQHGGTVEAGSPYVVGETQPELFVPNVSGRIMPSVPRGIGAASAAIVNGQLRGVIDINPSPLFMTSVAQTSASMIAANNRRLPSYLADRQRRGI